MKKIVKIFVSIIVFLFILILFMIWNDNRYCDKIEKIIEEECKIDNIIYINKYNDYYIVKDKEYLYLINSEYRIISEIDNNLLYENKENYDIIYDDEVFMYMDDEYIDGEIIYRYYDIYSYELINEIKVGG